MKLLAAEPDVQQPIAMCFDDRGRLWVVECYAYPRKVPAAEARDRILVFEDTDGDHVLDSRKVFAEGLNLASGIAVGFGGVWVGAGRGVDFNDLGHAFQTACVIPHLYHVIPGARYQRQAGQHFNPYTFDDIKTIARHRHWAGNQWNDADRKASDESGGGHAHSGACIYLGGSWPARYSGRLFMNNIHGDRLNEDRLTPAGSGYVGDGEPDFLFANDSWSQFISLQVGPDGQMVLLDWYDANECHHGNPAKHGRSNGRIFKVVYDRASPVNVDLARERDAALVDLLGHDNDWFVRHARRLLQERAAAGRMAAPTAWQRGWEVLSADPDAGVQRLARLVAVRFGDPRVVPQMRALVADTAVDAAARRDALAALVAAKDDGLPPVLWKMIADPVMQNDVLAALAAVPHDGTPVAIVAGYQSLSAAGRQAALATLVSRPVWTLALLDAIAAESVGRDYQTTILVTDDGRSIAGIVVQETPTSVTLQTPIERVTVSLDEIESRVLSPQSLMPENQLAQLSPEAARDLVAYLRHPTQVPLPGENSPSDPNTPAPGASR